jgi:glycosyltransferase involved in cell wall biosynthesis
MRVLHLALEDHQRPGSGGGSLRNHEINSRLAAMGFAIDVVTAAFPGARERIEDGVRYRHIGVPVGYAPSLLSYQASLPAVVRAAHRRARPDLIVEEFAPLTSSLGVGHWTRTPTLGLVQGFFAREKASEYHLPARLLTGVERWGTRSHRFLIAVSHSLGRQLRAVAPTAEVSVVLNGVDLVSARSAPPAGPVGEGATRKPTILYLGRLEVHQKGLDTLIETMKRVGANVRLVLAGEGKDGRRLQRTVADCGLADRVSFVGPVRGPDKWTLISTADALILPSRFETFGITVLEAMACGTAVIASDLDCIRELVPQGAGMLVPSGDVSSLAGAIGRVTGDAALRRSMGRVGSLAAQDYGWDARAMEQGEVYKRAAERGERIQ